MANRKKYVLLGKVPLPSILGARLPSKEQVLLNLLHHIEDRKSIPEAVTATLNEVKRFWERASLPTMTDANLRKNVKKLYEQYKKLLKEKNRQTDRACFRRETWLGDLEDLFDVAAANVLELKIPQEDTEFLRRQREDRMSCSLGRVDTLHRKTFERKRAREIEQKSREERHAEAIRKQQCLHDTRFRSRSSRVGAELEESSTASEEDSDEDYSETLSKPSTSREHGPTNTGNSSQEKPGLKKRGSSEILNPSLTTTWDREGLSNRQATASFIMTAKSLGHDVTNFSVSPATVQRVRSKNRAKTALQWEAHAFENPPLLVLHWDGKLLPQAGCQRNHEDRITVIATGVEFEQILGVPVAADGTGQKVAGVVMQEVQRLGLQDKIIGLSFDTTASNSGLVSGACIRLQKELDRELLWLACRHHVYELVLKHSFEAACGPSSGPDIPIFKKFQCEWDNINTANYTIMNVETIGEYFRERHDIVMPYLKKAIAANHPREDYAELLNLCLLYMGGYNEADFPFRAPGAYHQARWMAKAIYCLKITLFETQTKLTIKQKNSVRRVTEFICFVYIMYWHETGLASHAPKNDLDLIQTLHRYPDKDVGDAALRSISRHLWYLSEELIGLAFFDPRVHADEKEAMLRNLERPPTKKTLKRLDGKNFIHKSRTSTLSSLVTCRSLRIFELLTEGRVTSTSAPEHVRAVLQDDGLIQKVHSLKVTNDCAERGIALIKRCQDSVRNEEQKQFLVRVIQGHREKVPQRTKKSYSEYSV